jgi:hypothetical protein
MKKIVITVLFALSIVFAIDGKSLAITPDIKANGSDGPVTINTGDTLSLTISLNAENSAGQNADWWLVYNDGATWYYSGSWQSGLNVTYQGALIDLSSFGLNVSGLSAGAYTFYFGVDTVMNGIVDTGSGQLYYDSVVVNVTSGSSSTLPDTGQTKSYTDTWGEDSDYTINTPSYTDNGNGTITDNVTGLMWQKQDDEEQAYSWYHATGTPHPTFNPDSFFINVCGSLTLAGYTDWRLPTRGEMMNMAYYETEPAIDTTYFPVTKINAYWTSTPDAFDQSFAWLMAYGGSVQRADKQRKRENVRCVRGRKTKEKSYTNNNDGTITDDGTGLIWQQTDDEPLSWEASLTYCENLTISRYNDWRLPNIKELNSIVDVTKKPAAIDTEYFGSWNAPYWTSTTNPGILYPGKWYVDFNDGLTFTAIKYEFAFVRCVRGGQ